MTEKRFVGLFQGDMLVSVKDTKTNNRVNIIQIIAIANELNDENEQLKTKNNAYLQDIEIFKEENTHLKLKNNQLKTDLNALKKKYKSLKHDFEALL